MIFTGRGIQQSDYILFILHMYLNYKYILILTFVKSQWVNMVPSAVFLPE